jgi:hypothetical protein
MTLVTPVPKQPERQIREKAMSPALRGKSMRPAMA